MGCQAVNLNTKFDDLCPCHAKLKQKKLEGKAIKPKQPSLVSRMFGKNSLQQKLDQYDIKIKVDKNARKTANRVGVDADCENTQNDKLLM